MNKYYLIIVLTALFSAVSQLLLNISNRKKHKSFVFEYLNIYVISAYALLALTLIINVYAMRFVELKNAHVIASLTYLFSTFLSCIFLKEKLTWKKLLGNAMIIGGILLFIM